MKKLPRNDASTSSEGEAREALALPHIPEDLLLKILKSLPPQQLSKCKCLSKGLLSQIEAPDFLDGRGNDNQLVGLAGDNLMTKLDFVGNSRHDFRLRSDLDFTLVHLVSSFHGVVCAAYSVMDAHYVEDNEPGLFDSVYVVSLWNPATRDVKVLPPPLLDPKLVNPMHNYSVTFGFGFHAQTKDYRVVRVVHDMDRERPFSRTSTTTVEVYSLSFDSWRVVPDVGLQRRYDFDMGLDSKRPLDGGGVYFWLGQSSDGYPHLVAFDFNTELFEEIPMSGVFGNKPPGSYKMGKLAVFKEKLVYIHQRVHGEYNTWVLDRQEVSWTKLHTISLHPHLHPICFSSDGMMVVGTVPEHEGPPKLFLSNPTSPKELHPTSFTCIFSVAAAHKESMVSIGGANGVTYRLDTEWHPKSSSWDLLLSQTIMAANNNLASRFEKREKDLMMFVEPKIVPRFLRRSKFPRRWSPPKAGHVKLNLTALWKSSSCLGTYGWIARDEVGSVLRVVCSRPFHMESIIVGQAKVVRDALDSAKAVGWKKILVEMDWKILVDIIKGWKNGPQEQEEDEEELKCLGSTLFSILKDIFDHMRGPRVILFEFAPISLNIVAHALALHGFTCDDGCSWGPEGNEMPEWLSNALARERR